MKARLASSVALGLLLAVLSGCGPDDEAPRVPGLSDEDRAKLPAPPPPAAEPAPAPKPPTFGELSNRGSAPPADVGPGALMANPADRNSAGTAEAQPEAPANEKKRDLGSELQTLLGQPTDCLDLQKVVDDGGKITVRVSAYVSPSGRITRANISAPGQPSTALSCIERRTVALKMQDPIDDAPRMVEAELKFEIARNQAVPPTAPPPEPSPTPSY